MVGNASGTFNASAISANFGYNAWYAQTDWRILRGEFFNIFNRTNFGIGGTPIRPNVVDTNPTTGRFGVTNGPRVGARTGQMALKINF